MYDYFYGAQADQFSFIRIPTILFSKEEFRHISPEAKVLYGILLKRMDLSAKNGWFDDRGRVYIICTLEEIMETMNCGNQKAVKLLEELMGRGLEVFKEQLIHLEEQALSSVGDAVGPYYPPRDPGGRLTSRKPRVRALSSSTRSVLMYSGGSRWLKEQSPWPSFTYRPPLLMAPATRASAAR